jgi:hypothetical protein
MTEPADEGVIRIFGLEDTDPARVDRRPFVRPEDLRVGWGDVPVDRLRQRVADFLAGMRAVLAELPAGPGPYELEQVQISAEISTKGQVSLLGTGGEVAGKAGITFTFKLPAT